MNGCFVPVLSLLTIDQRLGPTRCSSRLPRSWTNAEEVHSPSTALADERRLHESALDSRSVDRCRDPDLRARNRARDRGWHRIPWTGCLLVPEAARSQDRSQSQVTPVGDPLPWGSNDVTRVRPRGRRVDDRLMEGRQRVRSLAGPCPRRPRRARGRTPTGDRPGRRQARHPRALRRGHPRERRTRTGEGARPPRHPLGASRAHRGEGRRP